jgi:hypothetical protein
MCWISLCWIFEWIWITFIVLSWKWLKIATNGEESISFSNLRINLLIDHNLNGLPINWSILVRFNCFSPRIFSCFCLYARFYFSSYLITQYSHVIDDSKTLINIALSIWLKIPVLVFKRSSRPSQW